ncbi:hypothetical protein [Paracidovorax cattleyae]|uniref:hypothetical protein n=1 Tax=Paracidovorax cattleyae TaxID=80868 RepID=UPI001E5938E5|nr:hypothetical protein [Paracidovorax cattleyae]
MFLAFRDGFAASYAKVILPILFTGMQTAHAEPSQPKTTQEPRQVTSCGISFKLPRHLKITAPQRTVNTDGVEECEFQIEYAKRRVFEGTCREGDIRYPDSEKNECEWRPMDGPASQILVAKTNFDKDKKTVGGFTYKENKWENTEGARTTSEEVQLGNHYGHMSLATMVSHGTSWQRWGESVGYQITEYCCTVSKEVVLIQVSSDIAVYMAPPPRDTENGDECEIFCRSVRPAEPRRRPAAR